MKKTVYIIFSLIFILFLVSLSSCSLPNKDSSIDEVKIAKSIDESTSKPIQVQNVFTQSDPIIYFSFRINNLPKNTKLTAHWKYLKDGTEIPSELIVSGSGYKSFNLKRSGSRFPAGQYEVKVTTEVNGKTIEIKDNFEVTSEISATHLLNPVICKSVSNNSELKPIDISSEFSQSDPVIYFVIQSKGLPKDSKVSCLWLYKDTGDSIPGEIITDGSRNIAFNLKPNTGKLLPAGSYIVTASVTIGSETESISKGFEIKKASE